MLKPKQSDKTPVDYEIAHSQHAKHHINRPLKYRFNNIYMHI